MIPKLRLTGESSLKRSVFLLLIGLGGLISSQSLFGQSAYTWNGGGGDNNWTTGANWGGTAPGSPQAFLNFNGSTRLTPNNNFGNGSAGYQIYFKSGAGAFNLTGNSIIFYDFGGGSPNIQNEGATGQSVSFAFNHGNATGSGNFNINGNGGASGPLTFNGNISVANGTTITPRTLRVANGHGTGAVTFNGVLSDGTTTLKLSQIGTNNTTILTNNNTYSGGTDISGGTVRLDGSGTLGTGAVVISGAGQLVVNRSGAISINNGISVSGGTSNTYLTQQGAGTTTLGGSGDNSALIATVTAGTLVLGKTSSGSVHALGGGTDIVNSGGMLQLGGSGGDQIFDGTAITINSGGAFDLNGLTETISSISLNGTGIGGAGALTNSSATAATLTINNTSSLAGATTVGGTGDIAISGTGAITMGSATTLTKIGNNKLTLSNGASVDNVNLILTVNAGTVVLSKISTIGAHTVGGLTVNSGGTVQLGGSGGYQIYQGSTPTVNSGGVLDLNGQSQTFTSAGPTVSGTGIGSGGVLINTSGTAATLAGSVVLGANASFGGSGDFTIGGAISGSGKALTKVGAGKLTLGGTNSYSGNTTVSVGTLALDGLASINNSPVVSIAAGATFDVSAISSYTLSSSTTLGASGTGTVVGTSAAAIKGASGGSVSMGTQPVTLTYDGSHPALYVSQGTLSLGGNAFTINSASPLAVGTYTIIQQASGSITSSGNHTVSGTAIGAGKSGFISVSGANVILAVLNTTTTTLTRTIGASPSTYGDALTFHAVISPDPGNGKTITFMTNGVSFGTATTTSGAADLAISALPYSGGSPYTVTAVFPADSSYASSSGALSGGQQVNARPVALSGTRAYDGTTDAPAATLSVTNKVGGDTVNVSAGTGVLTSKNIGTQAMTSFGTLTLGNNTAGNYTLTGGSGSVVVTVRTLVVSATGVNKVYDGTTNAAVTLSSDKMGGDDVMPSYATASFDSASVGTNKPVSVSGISISGADVTNYVANTTASTIANITPASTTLGLTSSTNPAPPLINVTFTATVSPVATGGVTFRDGTNVLGIVALDGFGVAQLVTNALTHGSHTIAAEYGGEGNYAGSTNSLSQVINTAPAASAMTMGAQSAITGTLKIIGGKHTPTDPDGDLLVVSAVSYTSGNGATVATDGTNVTYTASISFTGTDIFSYTVSDGFGGAATATVTVTVSSGNSGQGFNQLSLDVLGGGDVRLTYLGIPGINYALDWRTNLSLGDWVPVATNVAATNGYLIFTNNSAVPENYFRTRYVP